MPLLPDALQLGPLTLPVFPLLLLLGALTCVTLAGRWAPAWGVHGDTVETVMAWALVGAVLGVKLLEVLRSPGSFAANPRLLLSVPTGSLSLLAALVGLTAGAVTKLGLISRRRGRGDAQAPPTPAGRVVDALALPVLVGLGVAALGVGDGRALPLALGWWLAAVAVWYRRRQAEFPGHVGLAAVVWGALALVLADYFRPTPTLAGGVTSLQLAAVVVALAAYVAARWRGRSAHRPVRRGQP